jgi:hypothetical protein
MGERIKSVSPFESSAEDYRTEERDRQAVQWGASGQRFEIAMERCVHSTTATKNAAMRRARKLARMEKVPVVLRDRMAKPGAQHLWLFRQDGTIRAIAWRVKSAPVERVH